MMQFPNDETLKRLRSKYPAGTKIRLDAMNDPYPLPSGTIGVVELVDDVGGIHCRWENGSGLAVYEAVDRFTIIQKGGGTE